MGQVIREQVPPLIEAAIEPHFRAIAEDLGRMEGKIDRFTNTVDSLSVTVRRHEEEWLISDKLFSRWTTIISPVLVG